MYIKLKEIYQFRLFDHAIAIYMLHIIHTNVCNDKEIRTRR